MHRWKHVIPIHHGISRKYLTFRTGSPTQSSFCTRFREVPALCSTPSEVTPNMGEVDVEDVVAAQQRPPGVAIELIAALEIFILAESSLS
jgi:hypothetical protein